MDIFGELADSEPRSGWLSFVGKRLSAPTSKPANVGKSKEKQWEHEAQTHQRDGVLELFIWSFSNYV